MATDFTTQSSNFLNALSGEVDPRTGLYGYNVSIAHLSGNAGQGPTLPVVLSYSPLGVVNTGFGIGVSLSITRYDTTTRTLQLSTGESYKVTETSSSLRVIHAKPINFKAEVRDDGYYIFYKNGTTERLTAADKPGKVKVTETIITPTGHTLSLAWENFGGGKRLNAVRDESSLLLTVAYSNTGGRITFNVWPDTAEAHSIQLALKNDYLASVTNTALSSPLEWSLEYTNSLLTKVTAPTGLTDRVTYSQQGHRFPIGGPAGTQPYVISYKQHSGGGSLLRNLSYQFTDKNFLGYGGSNSGSWSKDTDFLFGVLGDYEYGSTEKALDENGAVLATTKRTYSNYHLQTQEQVQRAGSSCTYVAETEYYAVRGKNFDDQPAQYQMPKKQTAVWTDSSLPEGERSRSDITLTEFDERGNPVRHESPDGTVTTYEFYPAAGDEDNCPPEPNGFVRFMKSITTIPRNSDYDDTQASTTTFTYDTLGGTDCVVQVTQSVFSGDTLLNRRTTEYQQDSSSTDFGRITSLVDSLYQGEQSYDTRQYFVTTVSNNLMNQKATLTGYDGLTITTQRELSALSGLLLSETDAQGNTVVHTYDLLGRPLTNTQATGTEYENTSSWDYAIEETGPVTTEKDAFGNQVRHCFDGAGRNVSQQRLDTDATQRWFDMATRQYNLLGEYLSGTGQDWLTADATAYRVQGAAEYDGWGTQSVLSFSDNTRSLREADPISLTMSQSSQGGSGEYALSSGKITTLLDEKSRLPLQIVQYNAAGDKHGVRQYVYDGLNRVREEKDERGNITLYTYDDYGRELTRTLADGTVVTREYAPHLSGAYAVAICVTGPDASGTTQTWTVGTRQYDSLARLTKEVVGGRETLYCYDGASPVPAQVTQPSGDVLKYTYIAELDNSLSSVTGSGIKQTLGYDNKTGDLLQAMEGDAENSAEWTPSGQLREEHFTRDGVSRQATHSWTLGGEPATYTDITGGQTVYKRNAHGQVVSITDGALTVELTYDVLQRLCNQTVADNASDSALITELTYDDFNRETLRVLTDDDGTELSVEQRWYDNGQLKWRQTRQDGDVLREEQYDYDSRNRLVTYTVTGTEPPPDGYGNRLSAQNYQYDALNNLTVVTTTLADGSTDNATYHYQNADDPTQLSAVMHTHAAYPPSVSLEYDANGRMSKDEAGRLLSYDAAGRLRDVDGGGETKGTYGYNALDQLVSQNVSAGDTRQLYYRGGELVNEVLMEQARETRWIKNGHHCLGLSDGDGGLTLTGGDQNASLLRSRKGGESKAHGWSPYGSGDEADLLPGFNGERTDPVSGTYHLGNGYRAYNPVLMRFNCPDSLSPFGAGGINPYAYCAGDPINFTDPSGHIGWSGWLGIGLGIAGLLAAVFTAGTSVIMAGIAQAATTGAAVSTAGAVSAAVSSASAVTLTVGGLSVVADVTAIVSGALEDKNPRASAILGWTSLGLGVAGAGVGIGKAIAKSAFARPGSQVTRGGSRSILDDANYVRWGSEARNLTKPNSIEEIEKLYYFTDTYKNAKRLNIFAHGSGDGTMSVLVSGSKYKIDATLLKGVFDRELGMELNTYSYIRLISCHSAEGINPLGKQVAIAFNKETKAFRGLVDSLSPEKIQSSGLNSSFEFESKGKMVNILSVMKRNNMKLIKKSDPTGQLTLAGWTGYNPVKFYPNS